MSSISLSYQHLFPFTFCQRKYLSVRWPILEAALLKKFTVQSVFTDAVYTVFSQKTWLFILLLSVKPMLVVPDNNTFSCIIGNTRLHLDY